jgi:branched-chain amino acid transport system substrate-binding protein
MLKRVLLGSAMLALAVHCASAQQRDVKIGFVTTLSGAPAAVGNDMRDAFELALDHLGRKMSGLPVQVIYEDDGLKPELGKQKTDRLIESENVNFLTGYMMSHILLASLKSAVDAKTFLISANAGPSQIAGELCSPWFFSSSWQGDQVPQAIGEYMNQKNVKTAYLIAPNYAAGKDVIAGLKANFRGQVLGEDYTRWPDQLDFSPELSKARAARPDAIFAFYPGPAGIQFLTQYSQFGLRERIPLYTAFIIDALSLPRLGELALGIPGAQHWVADLPNDANKRFVSDFKKKMAATRPSMQLRPMTRPCSSTAASAQSGESSPTRTAFETPYVKPTINPYAARTNTGTTIFRSRTSIFRKRSKMRAARIPSRPSSLR